MCLYTTKNIPNQADFDITVWKDVKPTWNGNALAIFRNFKYKKGVLNSTEMCNEKANDKTIQCFDGKALSRVNRLIEAGVDYFSVTHGFHACISNTRILYPEHVVKRFTTPKGSLYYLDNTGLIVSNQIIYTPEN